MCHHIRFTLDRLYRAYWNFKSWFPSRKFLSILCFAIIITPEHVFIKNYCEKSGQDIYHFILAEEYLFIFQGKSLERI